MFTREGKRLALATSPSYMPNNFSSSCNGNMSLARGSDVYVVRNNGESNKVALPKSKITQAKFVEVNRSSLLAITSDQGLEVWTGEGNSSLFNFSTSNTINNTDELKFMRGIDASGNDLVVGCSNGNVLIFDCSHGPQSGQFHLLHTLETERQAIQCVGASHSTVAVGDSVGNIFVYNALEAYRQCAVHRGTGVPVTAIVVYDDVVIAGYSTGHIRIFRGDDINELAVEIAAHTRAVSGLAIEPVTQLVASVSGDQYLHVWSVPTFKNKAGSHVNCVFSDFLDSHLCTGVAFLGDSRIAVASYDEEELVLYGRA